ncbi:MAG: type II toxin-antitoxin system VapC family toxin [Cyclonatronaceae bacterium]
MLVTVDTSVIIAIIFNEQHKDELISLTKGKELIAPESMIHELGNALSAMIRRERITFDSALNAHNIFRQIPIRMIPIEMKPVLEIVSEHKIYAYDAYMLWCALNTGSLLLSLDEQMNRVARLNNIDILENNS